MLEEATALARNSYPERVIDLNIQRVPWPVAPVSGDRDMLVVVFRNLIDNALKYSADDDRVEVRAKVWANARTEDRAEEIASAVEVRMDGGRLSADGPDTGRRESWGVSWEVMVPATTDLDIETHNGGVAVMDVRGDIRFEALNGGVSLTGVAGDVVGRTTNGGLNIELDGNNWSGEGLDVETTNGGIKLLVPANYSAELETGTVNGGIDVDFPVTVQGRIGRRLSATLGEGGPLIRAVTTNGGVHIVRGESAIR